MSRLLSIHETAEVEINRRDAPFTGKIMETIDETINDFGCWPIDWGKWDNGSQNVPSNKLT